MDGRLTSDFRKNDCLMKKMKTYMGATHTRLLLIIACLPVFCAISKVDAQKLSRQSIGSLGIPSYSGSIYFGQSIGQPYNTATFATASVHVRPGFQQPVALRHEYIQSDMKVAMNVFPNPATASVTIRSAELIDNAVILIRDNHGNALIHERVDAFSKYSFNCESWPAGLYFITIHDSNANTQYLSKLLITK